MSNQLLPCPFCNAAMSIESNRDWHRIVGEHDDECVFTDSETMMVPATDEQLALAVRDWNRRATQPAAGRAIELLRVVDHYLSGNSSNAICSGSWLHREIKGAMPSPPTTEPVTADAPAAWMTKPRLGAHDGNSFLCGPNDNLDLEVWLKPFPVYTAPPAAAHGTSEFFVDFDTLRKALSIYGLAAPVSNEELGLQMERQAVRVIEAVAKLPFPTSAAAHGDEAVRVDAERYRWLRACGDEWGNLCFLDSRGDVDAEALDEAIDAAMRAQGDGGKA